MEMKLKMPGGEMASRPLHFFWAVDCSGSMSGSKIDAVNHAIQEWDSTPSSLSAATTGCAPRAST